jgi:hypothetical protein
MCITLHSAKMFRTSALLVLALAALTQARTMAKAGKYTQRPLEYFSFLLRQLGLHII